MEQARLPMRSLFDKYRRVIRSDPASREVYVCSNFPRKNGPAVFAEVSDCLRFTMTFMTLSMYVAFIAGIAVSVSIVVFSYPPGSLEIALSILFVFVSFAGIGIGRATNQAYRRPLVVVNYDGQMVVKLFGWKIKNSPLLSFFNPSLVVTGIDVEVLRDAKGIGPSDTCALWLVLSYLGKERWALIETTRDYEMINEFSLHWAENLCLPESGITKKLKTIKKISSIRRGWVI